MVCYEAANGNWSKIVLDHQIDMELIKDSWSKKDISKPIGVSSYEISRYLPKELLDSLPMEDDINLYIDIEEGKV